MLLIHILSYVFLIIRPPLSSTRNETLIPCTTVFRSRSDREDPEAVRATSRTRSADARRRRQRAGRPHPPPAVRAFARRYQLLRTARRLPFPPGQAPAGRPRGLARAYRLPDRSVNRPVGKPCFTTCRSRSHPQHHKQHPPHP